MAQAAEPSLLSTTRRSRQGRPGRRRTVFTAAVMAGTSAAAESRPASQRRSRPPRRPAADVRRPRAGGSRRPNPTVALSHLHKGSRRGLVTTPWVPGSRLHHPLAWKVSAWSRKHGSVWTHRSSEGGFAGFSALTRGVQPGCPQTSGRLAEGCTGPGPRRCSRNRQCRARWTGSAPADRQPSHRLLHVISRVMPRAAPAPPPQSSGLTVHVTPRRPSQEAPPALRGG